MPIGIGSELNFISWIVTLFLISAVMAVGDERVLQLDSEFFWQDSANWFGGLSGVELSSDGGMMTVVTDRGRALQAIVHREAGSITSVEIVHSVAIRDAAGTILRKPFTDAEGLAVDAQGQYYVSFEGQHRIAQLDVVNGVTTPYASLAKSEFLGENSGLEALAIGPDGTVFAIPEDTDGDHFPLYAFKDGARVVTAQLPKHRPFVPVGADFDGQGRLYLLERTVTPLGFRTQIRRFDLDTPVPQEITLLKSLPSRFDNLEGITVWRDGSGQTHLTLVSDDNFLPFQSTQIIEFSVTD